jgi:hypothetical protein
MASETANYQKVILSDQAPTDESLSGHREIQVVVRSPSKVTERKLIDVASSFSPDGHGRGTPAQPCAFRGFSYVLLQLEGPTQFFQFGRIVGTEPCPKSPIRGT